MIRPRVLIVGMLVAAVVLAGCEGRYRPLPYRPKAPDTPPILACHDGVGHIEGRKPWVLGGTCCCTPTPANFALHQKQGTIDKSMAYEAYLALHKERGIVTDLDHKGCGNLCAAAPHVVLGGKCMATPTPGAGFYERVTFGPHEPLVGGASSSAPDAAR
jgi:hypothetical protein